LKTQLEFVHLSEMNSASQEQYQNGKQKKKRTRSRRGRIRFNCLTKARLPEHLAKLEDTKFKPEHFVELGISGLNDLIWVCEKCLKEKQHDLGCSLYNRKQSLTISVEQPKIDSVLSSTNGPSASTAHQSAAPILEHQDLLESESIKTEETKSEFKRISNYTMAWFSAHIKPRIVNCRGEAKHECLVAHGIRSWSFDFPDPLFDCNLKLFSKLDQKQLNFREFPESWILSRSKIVVLDPQTFSPEFWRDLSCPHRKKKGMGRHGWHEYARASTRIWNCN
jgi:hypothetical protein